MAAQPNQNSPKNDVNSVKFIEQNYQEKFTEEKAKLLFNLYKVDEKDDKLQPPDIRKLLFDLLEAKKRPLIVPDEALDEILNELCLDNKEATISWVEFKSFFLFLEDTPLVKLFQLITRIYDIDDIKNARHITLTPLQDMDDPSFDRQLFKDTISKLLPEATKIFIYFLGGGSMLGLVLGTFKEPLEQIIKEENIDINNILYGAEIRAFDIAKDMFPPIQRAGGVKSKVARKLADTYVLTKTWDEKHLKLGQKVNEITKKVKESAKELDGKYNIQAKVNSFSKTLVESVKGFDEKHQISQTITSTAKNINDQYKISQKVQETVDNIKNNEKVQSVSNKVSKIVNESVQTLDDITKETKQLVQEKEQDIKYKNEQSAMKSQNQPQGEELNQEGYNNNNNNNKYYNNNNNNNNNNDSDNEEEEQEKEQGMMSI